MSPEPAPAVSTALAKRRFAAGDGHYSTSTQTSYSVCVHTAGAKPRKR